MLDLVSSVQKLVRVQFAVLTTDGTGVAAISILDKEHFLGNQRSLLSSFFFTSLHQVGGHQRYLLGWRYLQWSCTKNPLCLILITQIMPKIIVKLSYSAHNLLQTHFKIRYRLLNINRYLSDLGFSPQITRTKILTVMYHQNHRGKQKVEG